MKEFIQKTLEVFSQFDKFLKDAKEFRNKRNG